MKRLTSRERLTRLFNGQSIDRIPMWMLFPNIPWKFATNVFEQPSYASLNKVVYEKTDMVYRIHIPRAPFLNTHPDVLVRRDAGYTEIKYKDLCLREGVSIENGRKVIKPLCETIDDLEALLEMPFRLDTPDFAAYERQAGAIGESGVPCLMMPDPLEFAHNAFSETEFPVVCYLEEKRMKACLDELQLRTLAYYRQWLDRGYGDIYWINGMEYIVPPLMGPAHFSALATENDRQLVELVRSYGKKSMVHCHGRIGTLLDQFRRIGMDSLHPVEAPPMGDTTLSEAREALCPGTILVGNIQYGDLFHGFTEDEMGQMTLNIIEESRKGPIILAITGSPTVDDLPPHAARNYLRIIETCLEYGRYD